jgi:hypothetical protein
MPTIPRLLLPVAVGGAVLIVTGVLNGCSALMTTQEDHWTGYSAAQTAWPHGDIPAWIASDATDVHLLTVDDATAAVVRVATTDALPDDCTAADRRSVPFASRDWIPRAATTSDDIVDCGDYQVVAVKGGFVGWYVQGEGPHDGTPLPTDRAK